MADYEEREKDALEAVKKETLTVEIEGETYEFRFTPRRIEVIEKALGVSLMAALRDSMAMLSLEQFKVLFVYGLKKVEGPYLSNMKFAEDAFYELLESTSYQYVGGMIVKALERDCPFFFREG